eukprot:TRINITY_DN1527_c4_g1_i1.p1 TRINITY_DN1527_c4_g1~~TRINITY_DN1527_c4_g1_i1.p1  ORF type:complete len:552 (+),score=128.06 TRINITY_DN1527_c4_g1_i1:74-1729(+)
MPGGNGLSAVAERAAAHPSVQTAQQGRAVWLALGAAVAEQLRQHTAPPAVAPGTTRGTACLPGLGAWRVDWSGTQITHAVFHFDPAFIVRNRLRPQQGRRCATPPAALSFARIARAAGAELPRDRLRAAVEALVNAAGDALASGVREVPLPPVGRFLGDGTNVSFHFSRATLPPPEGRGAPVPAPAPAPAAAAAAPPADTVAGAGSAPARLALARPQTALGGSLRTQGHSFGAGVVCGLPAKQLPSLRPRSAAPPPGRPPEPLAATAPPAAGGLGGSAMGGSIVLGSGRQVGSASGFDADSIRRMVRDGNSPNAIAIAAAREAAERLGDSPLSFSSQLPAWHEMRRGRVSQTALDAAMLEACKRLERSRSRQREEDCKLQAFLKEQMRREVKHHHRQCRRRYRNMKSTTKVLSEQMAERERRKDGLAFIRNNEILPPPGTAWETPVPQEPISKRRDVRREQLALRRELDLQVAAKNRKRSEERAERMAADRDILSHLQEDMEVEYAISAARRREAAGALACVWRRQMELDGTVAGRGPRSAARSFERSTAL